MMGRAAIAAAVLLCLPLAAQLAQLDSGAPVTSEGFEKRINGKNVLRAVEPVRALLQAGSAVFYDGHDIAAYGLIVSPDGYILSKASQLQPGKEYVVRIGENKYAGAERLAEDEKTDLALYRVKAAGLTVLEIDGRLPELGEIMVSNASSTRYERRARIGVVSGKSHPVATYGRDLPYLGIQLEAPAAIKVVAAGSPAEKAGLQPGDIVVRADQETVNTMEDLGKVLSAKSPGDLLAITVKRQGRDREATITLGSRIEHLGSDKLPPTRNDVMSGKVSARRDGFEQVIEHDTPLSPEMMGGPLLDLHGRVRGINIARANRVETFALPVSLVMKSWAELKERISDSRRSP